MKKILLVGLLLITGCVPKSVKQDDIHDLDNDFPIMDTISYKSVRTFEIPFNISSYMVKDSTFFVFGRNVDNFGSCFNLNSGKELSVLLGRGNAGNEMINIPPSGILFWGDSIQFPDYEMKIIKTFAVNDILTKPLGDRPFSTIELPNSIPPYLFVKIGNNKVIGTVSFPIDKKNYKYFIYDGNEVSLFGDFDKEMFESNVPTDDNVYRDCFIPEFACHEDKVVTVSGDGFLLEVIDANKKTIDMKRYYNKIKINDRGRFISEDFCAGSIRCDDNYIYCEVTKKDNEKTKETGRRISDKFIYVFDWKLNPVKKYYLGSFDLVSNRYYYSEDGKSFYYLTNTEEQQVLFKGEIQL